MSMASSLFTLAKVAARRPSGLRAGATVPVIVKQRTITVDDRWLRDYQTAIGAVDNGLLPPCAVQVLASPLHTAILGDARFPLPAPGMVHIDNRIEERAAIPAGSTLQIVAQVGGHEPHDRGVTFAIVTTAHVDGVLVWSSTMTALVRTKKPTSPPAPKPPRAATTTTAMLLSSSSIRVRADQGRRYARVSGDANPIHLSALTAKPLGFPRAIAHGMWTLARALSEADDVLPSLPRTITARFIKPVLLPSTVIVEVRKGAGNDAVDVVATVDIVVGPERSGAPHVVIAVTKTVPGTKT